MKLLFDQGTPAPLRRHLTKHAVETAYEKGWGGIGNGELLKLAEDEGFDALVTTDQNIRYPQNLSGRRISIVVLMTTSWPRTKKHAAPIAQTIDGLQPGSYLEIPI